MFCTNCGKEIDNDSLFCTHCGAKQIVEEPATADVSKSEPVESVQNVTDNSGSENNEKAEFDPVAPNVGGMATTPIGPNPVTPPISEPQPAAPVNPEASGSNSKGKKSNSFVLIGIAAVVVIVLAFLIFGGKSGYKDYKELVQDYYTAIYKKDFNALLKCYDKEDQKDLKEDKEDIKDELKDLREFYDDNYDRGWSKKIKVRDRSKMDSDDGVTYYRIYVELNGNYSDSVYVKKYKDRYYIDADRDRF